MSALEQPYTEAKSSVKISMTAKGEATVDVKVYDGVDPDELDRLRDLAVRTYQATAEAVRGKAA